MRSTFLIFNLILDNHKKKFHQYFSSLFKKPENVENMGVELQSILPQSELSIFSYKLDVVHGTWIRWSENLPLIPKSFVASFKNIRLFISINLRRELTGLTT